MTIKVYEAQLPQGAMAVRKAVFEQEQGFVDEFDQVDLTATHLVMFDETDTPVATCRVFRKDRDSVYYLGRLAVLKSHRGRGLGAGMMRAAEDCVRQKGGRELRLHAQRTAIGFYRALGYTAHGQPDEEQGCPHQWMRKTLD